jgi:D-alanyl-D-alanine carboxypeptidase-like protein
MRPGPLSKPSKLFDAALYPAREGELAEMGLEVVARPGMAAPTEASSGLMALRRGLGEHNLAIASPVERIVEGRATLEAGGVACEGYGDGVFVEVSGGPGGRRIGMRIAGLDGEMRRDTVLLGPLRTDPVRPSPPPFEDTDPSSLAMLLAAVYALRGRRRPTLREEYVRSLLEPSTGPSPLRDEIRRAVADFDRRQAALPAGSTRDAAVASIRDELARSLLAAAERAFILDTQRSSLELLEPAERDRYLGFEWQDGDFPGGPAGPNEARADQMFDALTRLRPERRANSGNTAAVREDEFDRAMQERIRAAVIPVPGEGGLKLNRDASAAYGDMRTAAAADGVTIAIGNSYRSAKRARANAASAGNPNAVASFSSHTLGLAVDLNMSHSGLSFIETGTTPFRNLVGMYKSPVHKWMFLRGEAYGWFPYRREPWHWEYNPPGFRERLRQRSVDPPTPTTRPAEPPPTTVPREDEPAAEGINDPVPPLRPALAIAGRVGRGGRNMAPDVRAVQDRLVELRALDAADAAPERPPAAGAVVETSLTKTIEAIERFQRRLGLNVDAAVDVSSPTRTELDRSIPEPTAAEFAAVTTELGTIGQSIGRGLTLAGAVGATATGNAPNDVQAVQRRLVELGKLAASHRETPATGATGAVAQTSLRATIAALRAFQADVRFWISQRGISGAITPGVAAPGDATAALLDRISVYTISSGAGRLSFRDHVVSGNTRSDAGVMFVGTAAPSAIPVADYVALGLTAGQAAALKLVSTHEGNFDAINTYDRAIVSAGFIQFAGGRGLPRYLALLKARQPAKFRDLLQKFGIEAEFTVAGGAIDAPRVAVLDPAGARVLRATAAETAIRDDKKLTAALILSGRDRDVQLTQIEAAIRDYVIPALSAAVSWASGRGRARLGELLRSQKGMAALFDRTIQEGLGGARRRFERVIQRLARSADPTAVPPTLVALQSREGDVLAELEHDLQSAADVGAAIARARASLQTLVTAAGAAGATLAGLLARSDLSDARRAVTDAKVGLSAVVNVNPPSGQTVDAALGTMTATLTAEETRLALTPAPPSLEALTTALTASRQALATVAAPLSTAPMFLARIQRIRRSTLDSSLAEAV